MINIVTFHSNIYIFFINLPTSHIFLSLELVPFVTLFLSDNYRDLVGDFIPYKKFKFDSLEKFVSSIPGIQISQDKCGQVLILKDPKYTHLHKPIAKPNCETNEKVLVDYFLLFFKNLFFSPPYPFGPLAHLKTFFFHATN